MQKPEALVSSSPASLPFLISHLLSSAPLSSIPAYLHPTLYPSWGRLRAATTALGIRQEEKPGGTRLFVARSIQPDNRRN